MGGIISYSFVTNKGRWCILLNLILQNGPSTGFCDKTISL